ncbi:hypothetical protein ACFQ14_03845 [Pseudahrensia aquimaris]|uniref:Uncharacterized protein n=1 Tax=Pseudahrensia aquimaris TaxID=744461 RepID=A0ABW3FBH1_9HYPH
MGRMFWILMSVMGVALVLLVLNHDSGMVMGISTGAFASLVALLCFALFVGSGALSMQQSWSSAVGQFLIWVTIFLVMMSGYVIYQLYFAPPAPPILEPVRDASLLVAQALAWS